MGAILMLTGQAIAFMGKNLKDRALQFFDYQRELLAVVTVV